MNERIKELWSQTVRNYGHSGQEICAQQFAELIIQECANYIRENYDSWDAEPLAHNLEVDFGLHGDYAE
jgi:hypothetical protein